MEATKRLKELFAIADRQIKENEITDRDLVMNFCLSDSSIIKSDRLDTSDNFYSWAIDDL